MHSPKHISAVREGSSVNMPTWQGERHYMLPFTVLKGLPPNLRRFQQAVDQMMEGIIVDGHQECYIMIDEKMVVPNGFHRRPGLHVDGYWHPGLGGHHQRIMAHQPGPPGHGPEPQRGHSPRPTHGGIQAKGHEGHSAVGNVGEGLILASNYGASRALLGSYERDFVKDWRKGDCTDLDVSHMEELFLEPNRAYHLDVMTLHESLPIPVAVKRTLIRLNVPNWLN